MKDNFEHFVDFMLYVVNIGLVGLGLLAFELTIPQWMVGSFLMGIVLARHTILKEDLKHKISELKELIEKQNKQ